MIVKNFRRKDGEVVEIEFENTGDIIDDMGDGHEISYIAVGSDFRGRVYWATLTIIDNEIEEISEIEED